VLRSDDATPVDRHPNARERARRHEKVRELPASAQLDGSRR
jgi:hypothetical protein